MVVRKESFFSGIAYIYRAPAVRKLLLVFFGFHVAYQSIWTFLPLRVQDIIDDAAALEAYFQRLVAECQAESNIPAAMPANAADSSAL